MDPVPSEKSVLNVSPLTSIQSILDRILSVATLIFIEKGYQETYMHDIAKICDISMVELHIYFDNKEDIAIAVMAKTQNYFDNYILSYAYNKKLEPLERSLQLNTALETFFVDKNSGCVFLSFLIATISHVPAFIVPIRHYFRSFSAAYMAILSDCYDSTIAQSLADDFASDLQGALIMSRVTGTVTPIRRLSLRMLQML
jgi:AcrR family transcriptional regulator